MTDDTREELGFPDWLKKVNERITLLQLNMVDKKDITEDDYFLLEVMYRVHWQGFLPFYRATLPMDDEKAEQTGLFADNVTEADAHDDLAG